MPKLIDNVYAVRFATLLYMDWNKWDAYKQGVIDASGNVIKAPKTIAETTSFTYLHRLVASIKRLVEAVPGGKTKLGKVVALYMMLRESVDDEALCEMYSDEFWLSELEYVTESYQLPDFKQYQEFMS